MMPLSYQSIGFTSIVLMVVILVINEGIRYLKTQLRRPSKHKSEVFEK
jgi:hypothetical protein